MFKQVTRDLNELATSSRSHDEELVATDELHCVLDLISRLGIVESTVLRMRFGLDEEPQTRKQIADSLNLTTERVKQIEQVALTKIRERMED